MKLKHLDIGLARERRQEVLDDQEQAADLVARRSFWAGPKSRTWVDDFGDTVFPEFDKPGTWNPND